MLLKRPLFRKYGKNFIFHSNSVFSFNTIEVGNDVYIGPGAHFRSPNSKIVIGNKVMFGPYVRVLGGDHNFKEIGQYIRDVKNKNPKDDQPIYIEDDVWIGAGATILKGVRIGRGSVIGAGAIVTKNVEPYSIFVPAKGSVIKKRFNEEERAKHEELLRKSLV